MLMFSDIEGGANPGQLSGLQAWYDASRTPLGTLASLPDFSGNNNTATQVSLALQPTNTAGQINNKNAILFGGSQYMILPSGTYNVATAANTIFYVSNCTDETADRYIVSMNTGGAVSSYINISAGATGIQSFHNGTPGTGQVQKTGITKSNYNIFTAGGSGGASQFISVNNGTQSINNNATYNTPVAATIGSNASGASGFLIGGIAEIIMYNRALSDAEIAQVNRYLSNKYAITIS